VIGSMVRYLGARQMIAGTLSVGAFFTYNILLGYVGAPVIGIVSIGTQITEAIAGLDRMREVLNERPEDEDPQRTLALPEAPAGVRFEGVDFSYEKDKPGLKGVSFGAPP